MIRDPINFDRCEVKFEIDETGKPLSVDKKTATKYLLNAYYKIEKDITISAETFSGLGTLTNPFSGVIIGNTSDANQPVTVHITKTNANKDSFGGLIAYSRGSVVKDLTVDYSQAAIKMNADTCPGTLKNPFFGGVVGYCMGGDTGYEPECIEDIAGSTVCLRNG